MLEPSVFVIIAIFIPLIAAAAINLLGNYKNLRDGLSIICGAALTYIIYLLSQKIMLGEVIEVRLFRIMPDIPFLLKIEPLGLIFAGLASSLWVVTSIYSIGYLRYKHDEHQTRFFIYLGLSIAFSIGIAFAGNLITMLIFYEALTLATYPLVAHKGDAKSLAGARKYLAYLLGSSIIFLIPAIILTHSLAGTGEFTSGGVFQNGLSTSTIILLLLLFAYGIGKAALMPMHRWLPATMVAPTPVSALLHAVAVVKAGVFCLIKILVYIFGLEMLKFSDAPNIIAYIAAFTIIYASLIALRQGSLKTRLAYSTISQLSYIILAGALLNHAGVTAAATHMASHAVGKITLFFVAGVIIIICGKNNVSELNGLGRKMPFIFGCFLIASLSLIGLPILAGGESKELIFAAATSANMQWVIYLLYISIAPNAAHLLPVCYRGFALKSNDAVAYKTPVTMQLAIGISTLLVLAFSLYSPLIFDMMGNL